MRGAFGAKLVFDPQDVPATLHAYCDSDHAGDPITRRSRSGLALQWGSHCLKHSSTVQSTVSLSSGESEYYALLRASAHLLGMKSLLGDWGYEPELVALCDSSAARGIAARQGLGRVRHVDVRYLWLQQQVQHGRLRVESVDSKENWSDLFTKVLPESDARKCCKGLCFELPEVVSSKHRSLVS